MLALAEETATGDGGGAERYWWWIAYLETWWIGIEMVAMQVRGKYYASPKLGS